MDRYFFFLSDEAGEEYCLTIDTDSFVTALQYVYANYTEYFVDQWRRRSVTMNPANHVLLNGKDC